MMETICKVQKSLPVDNEVVIAVPRTGDRLTVQQPLEGDVTSSRKLAEKLQLGPLEEFRRARDDVELDTRHWFCRSRGTNQKFSFIHQVLLLRCTVDSWYLTLLKI